MNVIYTLCVLSTKVWNCRWIILAETMLFLRKSNDFISRTSLMLCKNFVFKCFFFSFSNYKNRITISGVSVNGDLVILVNCFIQVITFCGSAQTKISLKCAIFAASQREKNTHRPNYFCSKKKERIMMFKTKDVTN